MPSFPSFKRLAGGFAVCVSLWLIIASHQDLRAVPNKTFFGWGTATPNNSSCTNGANDGSLYIETDAGKIWTCRTDGDWYDIISGASGGSGIITCASANMSATAATCTPSASVSDGDRVDFIPDTDSDAGGYTLDVGGGAVDVLHYGGSDVETDEFAASKIQELVYDSGVPAFYILTARGTGPARLKFYCGTAPSSPAAGYVTGYCTSKTPSWVNEDGTTLIAVQPSAESGSNVVTGVNTTSGALIRRALACSDLTDSGAGCSGSTSGYGPTSAGFFDDFQLGYTGSLGTIGNQNWTYTYNSGAPTFTGSTEAGHPGILTMQVNSGAPGGDVAATRSYNDAVIGLNSAVFSIKCSIKTGSSTTSLSKAIACGAGQDGNDGILAIFRPGTDTNWMMATCSLSASCNYTDSGVAYATGTWYTITIDALAGGTVGITVNAGTRQTSTTNLPSGAMRLVAMRLETSAGAARTMSIDYYQYTQTVSGR